MVRINHTADPYQIARFKISDCGADFGNPTDNLMPGDAGVGGWHDTAPFVTDCVQIRVTVAAEEYFDLHVAFGRLTALDGIGCKW
jgi:hypothetical protein